MGLRPVFATTARAGRLATVRGPQQPAAALGRAPLDAGDLDAVDVGVLLQVPDDVVPRDPAAGRTRDGQSAKPRSEACMAQMAST
ncbi:hypothetical protein CG723_23215 [Streptomyces sp. CB01635]|nr:hypothetical protein CG723_23215 [Streptomyces sp. CB01635]